MKGQRLHTSSLITLKHSEPSPMAAKIVSNILLPKYGWKHKRAGGKYPKTEMSFRSTTSAVSFTNRGFRIVVDRKQRKVIFQFDASKADVSNPEIATWLESVKQRAGLGNIEPEPYWGFDDLGPLIATKLKNCFYVVADNKIEGTLEWFNSEQLYMLSGFSFEHFLDSIEGGSVLIDFDARSGHNHGTKFRLRQDHWPHLYDNVKRVI